MGISRANILLGADGQIQIRRFGCQRGWPRAEICPGQIKTYFVGTPCWMAPGYIEQVTGMITRLDIGLLGITAIELATGTNALPNIHQ